MSIRFFKKFTFLIRDEDVQIFADNEDDEEDIVPLKKKNFSIPNQIHPL